MDKKERTERTERTLSDLIDMIEKINPKITKLHEMRNKLAKVIGRKACPFKKGDLFTNGVYVYYFEDAEYAPYEPYYRCFGRKIKKDGSPSLNIVAAPMFTTYERYDKK